LWFKVFVFPAPFFFPPPPAPLPPWFCGQQFQTGQSYVHFVSYVLQVIPQHSFFSITFLRTSSQPFSPVKTLPPVFHPFARALLLPRCVAHLLFLLLIPSPLAPGFPADFFFADPKPKMCPTRRPFRQARASRFPQPRILDAFPPRGFWVPLHQDCEILGTCFGLSPCPFYNRHPTLPPNLFFSAYKVHSFRVAFRITFPLVLPQFISPPTLCSPIRDEFKQETPVWTFFSYAWKWSTPPPCPPPHSYACSNPFLPRTLVPPDVFLEFFFFF